MESFMGRFLLPVLLVTASLLNWSLISLVDLIAFLGLQLNASRSDFRLQKRVLLLWSISIFSFLTACLQVLCLVLWAINGDEGSTSEDWWLMLIGFRRFHVSGSPTAVYFSILHLLVGVVSLSDLYQTELGLFPWRGSCWRKIVGAVDQLGYYVKVVSCFLLPAIQLFVGISHPSWASLPFFICSCIGLVEWSLTSNYSGLFRWWRSVQLFAGINIALLYVYQLPVEFPKTVAMVANFIGFYKISSESDWLEISSGLSLIFFFFLLSSIKCDLEEMELFMSGTESDLTEHLLPSRHTFYIHQSRSGVRHTNVLVRGSVFRIFTINFFTYPCLHYAFGASILQAYAHLDCLLMLATLYMPSQPYSVCIS